MSVQESFDISIKHAIAEGLIDEETHGAAIEAARKVAAVMDDPEWPIVRGKIDNVSPSVFLKYCAALNIVPGEVKKAKSKRESEADKEVALTLVGNSKWKKITA